MLSKFFKTVAIVTVFSISEKFLGFLYRIFLSRTIGAEGVGLYQIALSIFAVLFTVSCSGIPITVSRLMTKYKAQNKPKAVNAVITAGIVTAVLSSGLVFVVMYFFHDAFAFLFTDKRCMNIFLVILFGLVFTSVYAVLRGVFWGNKDFIPYSVIELLEEVVMIIVGIILVKTALNVYDGAYKAGVAVLISYLFSFTIACTFFIIRGGKLANPIPQMKPLVSSAFPITAMRTANSFINSLVAIILPLRLVAAGMSSSAALSAFGSASGMAIPLLSVPVTLIGSFAVVLVPEISENFYKEDKKRLVLNIEKSLKMTTAVACLFIPIFFAFGKELGILIFDSASGGVYLSNSAYLMLPMALSSITTSILNSMGFENKTLLFYILSALIMIACIWILPKYVGIYALLVGFSAVFILTSILNLMLLKKAIGQFKHLKFFLLSTLFVIPVSIFGVLLKGLILSRFGGLLSVIFGSMILAIFYILLLYCFGMVNFDKLNKKRGDKNYHTLSKNKI